MGIGELLVQVGQFADVAGLIPPALGGTIWFVVGAVGIWLYETVREPSDDWDRFLKTLGMLMAVVGGVLFLAFVIRFIST